MWAPEIFRELLLSDIFDKYSEACSVSKGEAFYKTVKLI